MSFLVLDQYPSDAAKRADYISGSPPGDVIENGRATGPVIRPEKVVDTGIQIDFEGRLCFGERTVRHLAYLFGMIDGWRMEALIASHTALNDERDLLSRELVEARKQVENLLDVQREPVTEVFVALDGTHHASAGAAEDANRKTAGLAPAALKGMRPISAAEAPDTSAPDPADGPDETAGSKKAKAKK